jgi:hypothetical protein
VPLDYAAPCAAGDILTAVTGRAPGPGGLESAERFESRRETKGYEPSRALEERAAQQCLKYCCAASSPPGASGPPYRR